MTLTEFLLARIAEDEAPRGWRVKPEYANRVVYLSNGHDEPQMMFNGRAVTDPAVKLEVTERVEPSARVLAECEAKRRIVEMHAEADGGDPSNYPYTAEDGRTVWAACLICHGDWYPTRPGCDTLRLLALPYADHADYDESWRP